MGDFEQVYSSIATFELKSSESSIPSPRPSSTDSQRDYSEFPDLSDSVLRYREKTNLKIFFKNIVTCSLLLMIILEELH